MNFLEMDKQKLFNIDGGELIPFNKNHPALAFLPGCVPIFVEWEPGDFYFIGQRKLQSMKARPDGWSGWTHVHSEQVKASGKSVTFQGQQVEIGIVPYIFRPYPFPYPLESKDDSAFVATKGFNGKKTAKQWAASLDWKGVGSLRAAVEVRTRWSNLQNGMRTLAPCPHVTFPAPADPSTGERLETVEKELTELRAAMEDVKARLALLEFQP